MNRLSKREYHREYMKKWRNSKKGKLWLKENSPKYKEQQKKYRHSPEVKEWRKQYDKEYYKKNRTKILKNKIKYSKTHKEFISKRLKDWQKSERGQEWRQQYNDITLFGGNRIKALERDNYTCQECKKTKNETELHVHHIDWSGKSEDADNNLNNLITLCISCHARLHTKGIFKKCAC